MRDKSHLSIILPTILFLGLAMLFLSAYAAECPAGSRPAAEGDLAAMRAAGIHDASKGMCWDPSNPHAGSEIAEAKRFLISRYTPGPRSSVGLSDPQVEGIENLNPDFAVALARMLRDAPYMTIISAYRTREGQGSTNPESNHVYGCAVDLGYSQSKCTQQTCQWILKNAPSYGIHIRMKYSPEWNHVEPIAKDACRMNGPGVGVPAARPPSSRLSDLARDLLGEREEEPSYFQQEQREEMCPLPNGPMVPCSAIQNPGGSIPQAGTGGGAGVPPQPLSQSQQPTQAFTSPEQTQADTPVSQTVISPGQTAQGSSPAKDRLLSALERIEAIAEGPRATSSTATHTPLLLTSDVRAGVRIQSIAPPETTEPDSTTRPETVFRLTPTESVNTFTAPGGTGSFSSLESRGETIATGFQKILIDLQATLTTISAYLRPFGRPSHSDHGEDYDEWAE